MCVLGALLRDGTLVATTPLTLLLSAQTSRYCCVYAVRQLSSLSLAHICFFFSRSVIFAGTSVGTALSTCTPEKSCQSKSPMMSERGSPPPIERSINGTTAKEVANRGIKVGVERRVSQDLGDAAPEHGVNPPRAISMAHGQVVGRRQMRLIMRLIRAMRHVNVRDVADLGLAGDCLIRNRCGEVGHRRRHALESGRRESRLL
mmetsp:Transcript_7090/g.17136  ORF Transcript_7090/g.17136 Transcript_7090/m.17136 type:complete len:203 (+) Transcript_7090:155-763(+)